MCEEENSRITGNVEDEGITGLQVLNEKKQVPLRLRVGMRPTWREDHMMKPSSNREQQRPSHELITGVGKLKTASACQMCRSDHDFRI